MQKVYESIKEATETLHRKYYANFKKYIIVGFVFSLLEILFLWFFVDMQKKPIVVYSVVIYGASTILKFYTYVLSGMMKHNILGYIFVLVLFYLMSVGSLLLLVRVGFSAGLSSAFISMSFFLLRFLAYDKLKMLRN